jgi:polygalacturonase
VAVRGVNIDSRSPNNDGSDPESCTDMVIERCTFNTGDDCIAIKSGRTPMVAASTFRVRSLSL